MQVNPHLWFNGQCEAAFEFYHKCLGGKLVGMMTYGNSPMADQTPVVWREKIIHVTLSLHNCRLAGADVLPGSYQKPQGFSVLLELDDVSEAERAFNGLAEKATVQMPLQETFWARRFGMLTDQFGTAWMVSCGDAGPQQG